MPPGGRLTPPGIGQAHRPPPQRTIAPGGAAGILRARKVIVSGPANGVFVYNGTPASGDLKIAIAAQAGSDQFTPPNGWLAGITLGDLLNFTNYTWLDEFGDAFFFHNGVATISINPTTAQLTIADPGSLRFASLSSIEGTSANIASEIVGTGAAQVLQMVLSGPMLNVIGSTDWTQIQFNSGNDGATADANIAFVYIDINGTPHLYGFIDATGFNIVGSIVGIDPNSSPGSAAVWHTISLQNGYTAGTNQGILDVPQIRMMADNKNLQFKGSLTVPGAPGSNVWGLLPTGFPNANLGGPFGLGLIANYTGGVVDHVQVQNNSNISLANGTGHGGTNFNICCMVPTQ